MPSLFYRPQLHDVVLDFVLSKFSPDELRAAQVRFVDVVRASRPISGFGWSKFNCSLDPASNYIVNQLVHHVRAALPDGGVEQIVGNLKVQEWLDVRAYIAVSPPPPPPLPHLSLSPSSFFCRPGPTFLLADTHRDANNVTHAIVGLR